MKTKELMIGDWVYGTEKKKYGRVDKLEHDVEDESVEPIPLTAKILEKNGFVKGEFVKVGYKDIKVENHTITFNYPKYDIEVWEGELFLMRLPLNSVHELQHALRLCKIEKEIEL